MTLHDYALVPSLLFAALAACHGASSETNEHAVDAGETGETSKRAHAPPAQVHVAAVLPVRPKNAYIGSARCKECHAKEHAAWQKDWHAKALMRATPANEKGSFANVHYAGTSSEAWMKKDGAHAAMRTTGEDGTVADFSVDWLIGGKRMQDTVHVFPDGRYQVLPIYYHVTGKGAWVDYTEAKQGALTPTHPFYWTNFRRMANHECLDCHTTGLKESLDRRAHTWSTAMADSNVACESCHGPGERHAESSSDTDIVRPEKISRDARTALCAQCHGPRNPTFPLLDSEEHFRAGEPYDDSYDPVVVLIGNNVSDDFFADGRPKTSSFEYQAMVQSRCYRKSEMTCTTCHTAPHDVNAGDEVRKPANGTGGAHDAANATCTKCHEAIANSAEAHSHHKTATCVSCHMPNTVTGVLDTFADHAIDVPNPETTSRHAVPNACGTCHADRTPTALEAWMRTTWPDIDKRQARRNRLADAFDHAQNVSPEKTRSALVAVVSDADEAETLRGAALMVLAQRSPKDVAPLATALLSDASPLVRMKAATALGMARVPSGRDALAKAVGDRSLPVALAATVALTSVGDPRGTLALEELTKGARTSRLPQPHLALGIVKARAKDVNGALPLFQRAVELLPYSTDALLMLSDALARTGHEEDAKHALEDVLRIDPQNDAARKRLGDAR